MQTRRVGKKLLYRIAMVNPAIIQQDNQMASHLSQELTEECRHLFGMDIVLIKLAVQCKTKAFRTDGNTRDSRDPVTTISMKHGRFLSHGLQDLWTEGRCSTKNLKVGYITNPNS